MGTDVARQGQISAEISALEKAIEGLSDSVSRVEDRLGCALRNEPSTKDVGQPEQELVPLAQSVGESRRRVEMQTARLEDILSRLEL